MVNCVYIHIPFCLKKCNYCAFCSNSLISYKEKYIKALVNEIKFYYKHEKLKTIYFGGGTPSLLEPDDLIKILSCFNFDTATEITVECNPSSLNYEKLKEYKKIGINRISLGIQNFNDEILKILGRNHNREDIFKTIKYIKNAGFDNLSIDLMYGLPKQNIENWNKTLETALELKPKHISLYGLKIEKGTKFYKEFLADKNLPSQDMQANMYEAAVKKLKESYYHYEFSNFAKDKSYISKHNTCYWKRENYYGFGLSASGFINNKRYTNTFIMKEYLENPIKKEYKILTTQEEIEEEIFLGLRLAEGINFNYLKSKYNVDIYDKYKNIFEKYLSEGYILKTKKGVKLSTKGILVSNEILCEFIEL